MKLPDVGEGVAEAEIVEWLVAVGDEVTPDSVLAEVLTDKATVEVSSPVSGRVVELFGEPGDVLAVGADLVVIETDGDDGVATDVDERAADSVSLGADEVAERPTVEASPVDDPAAVNAREGETGDDSLAHSTLEAGGSEGAPGAERHRRPTASPAVRKRAATLGIDLASVPGSGPDGRLTHADLDHFLVDERSGLREPTHAARPEPVRGVRRQIAQRLSTAWQEIPHITYVEAIDVTELERLRAELNRDGDDGARLTLLPFLARGIVIALRDQPELNAHYDHPAEELTIIDAIHIGIATQTTSGLRVPVVAHAESLGLRDLRREIARVTGATRDGSATRSDLSGSTITITSLGSIGGIATTPIINAPEVAIIGVNKIEIRPLWRNGSFEPRQVLNLSSSFDHRIVDGWDAATFVQRLKTLLEIPALLFGAGEAELPVRGRPR
jgi:2-oxoisovalerate dehydrogenase E2 component (dihydrolipoyl transacylase)